MALDIGAKVTIDTSGVPQAGQVVTRTFQNIDSAIRASQASLNALARQSGDLAAAFSGVDAALGLGKVSQFSKVQQKQIADAAAATRDWAAEQMEVARVAATTQGKVRSEYAKTSAAMQEAFAGIAATSGAAHRTLTQRFKDFIGWSTQAGTAFETTSRRHVKASGEMARANDKVTGTFRYMLPHIRTTTAALGVYVAANMVRGVIRLADAFTDMTSRLKLVSGTTTELTNAQQGLFKIAQENRLSLIDTANLYYKLSVSMRDFGASQQGVLQTVSLVGKALRISGASTIEANAAVLQLAQAFAKGKLDGDEFRSVMENAPRLAKALTDEFKISKGELYKWSETGQISVEKLMQALKNQAGAIEGEFSRIPITISGAWTQIENAFVSYIGNADQATQSSQNFAKSLSEIAKNLPPVLELLGQVASVFATIVGWSVKGAGVVGEFLKNAFSTTGQVNMSEEDKRLLRMTRGQMSIDQIATGPNNGLAGEFFTGINAQMEKLTEATKGLTDVQRMIVQKALAAGLNPFIMLGLAQKESSFNPNALGSDLLDKNRGRGVFQFTPGTGARYGLSSESDLYDAEKNISAAMKHFNDLLLRFNGDVTKAIAAWNAGEGGVAKAMRKGRPLTSITYKPDYIPGVLDAASGWKKRLGGDLASVMDSKDLKKANAEVEKVLEEQFKAYSEHFKSLESLADSHNKVEVAKQQEQMAALEAQKERIRQLDEQALANAKGAGDMAGVESATKAAQTHELQFLEQKQALMLKGMDIEKAMLEQRKKDTEELIQIATSTGQEGDLPKLYEERAKTEAELQALAIQRKEVTIKGDAEIAAAGIASEQARRDAAKQTAELALAQQNEIKAGLMEEFKLQQQQADASVQNFGAWIAAEKDKIDTTTEAARAAEAEREAERNASREGLMGLAAVNKAREVLKANTEDQIDLLKIESQATMAKLQLDLQELQYAKAIAEWKLKELTARDPNDQSGQLEFKQKIADLEGEIAKNIEKQTQETVKLATATAKTQAQAAKQDAKIGMQEVRESQLEMNAFWDQLMQRVQEYAQTWATITGNMNDPFSEMMINANNFAKQLDQIGQYWQTYGDSWGDMAPMMKSLDVAQASLNMMAKTLLSLRSRYDEGTQGYKDMTAAAERMMEVQRALSAIEAVLGVIHQFTSGDVYTAIPRAIAVAAMMASLGYQTGLGGGNVKAEYTPQPGNKAGSVFGDNTAQSESISKSLAIIRDNTSNDLNYSAAMLRSLENIELALAGATNAIIRGVAPSIPADLKLGSIANAGQLDIGGLDFGAQMIGKFIFNVQREISDFGIYVLPHTIRKMFENGFQAASYTDVTTTTKVLGMSVSSSTQTYFKQLDAEVTKQFTGVITNVAKSVKLAGEVLGVAGYELTDRLNKFVIDFGRVSLANLKGEELQKKLEDMFSTMSDNIARAVVPGLGKFRQVGEGYFETMIRVAEGTQRARGVLEQLGMTAIDFKDITRKQGDVYTETVRQTIVAQGNLARGARQMINEFSAAEGDIQDFYKALVRASNSLRTAGFDDSELSRTMVNAAGGLQAFNDAMQTYVDTFLTAGERLAGQTVDVAAQFTRLGVVMPDSLEGFRALMEGIDTTTEAGKTLFGALLQVQEGFIKVAQSADDVRQKYSKYLGEPNKNAQLIKDVLGDFEGLKAGVIERIKNQLTVSKDPEMLRLLSGQNTYQTEIDITKGQIETVKAARAAAQKELDDLLAKEKRTKKEETRIAELRRDIGLHDNALAQFQPYLEQMQGYLAQAIKDIADYAATKSGPELAALLKQEGDVLLGTLGDIWDNLAANVQAARETFASINDSIAQLRGEALGTQGIIDYKSAKAAAAVSAAINYTENDAGTLNQLYKDAYQAVMDEYNARLDQLTAEKNKYEAIKSAAEQALQTLDSVGKGLQDLRNTIAQNLDELAKAGNYNSTEYETRKYAEAKKAIQDYFATLANGGTRNVETELQLLNDARQAIMDKYQAEVDAINRANQAQIDALTTERDERQKVHDEQIKALEEQKAAAEDLFNAVERVREYAKSLLLGQMSTLSPEQKLAEAGRQYQDLLAKANTGDAKAIAALTGASDAYLQAAKDYYGSGSAYTSVFDGVRQAMETIGGMSVEDPNSIQARIDELNKAHEVYLKSIDEKIADLTDPEKNEAIKALREKAAADLALLNGFAEKTQNEVLRQREISEKELADANAHLAPIDTNIAELKTKTADTLKLLADKMGPAIDAAAVEAQRQMANLIQQVIDTKILNADQLDVLKKMAISMGIPGYARGGQAEPGLALVGEQGPELVRFGSPAQVMTATQTRRILTPQDDEKIARAISDLKDEMRAVVVTQSRTNPALVEKLGNIESRLSNIERTQRVK